MTNPCPYATLRVARDAPAGAIRAAYKSRSRALHPDKNPGALPGAFADLSQAYRAIGTAAARAAHDSATAAAYKPKGADDPFADDAVRRAFAGQVAKQLGEEESDMFESLFGKTRAGYGHDGGEEVLEQEVAAGKEVAAGNNVAPWKPPDIELELVVSLVELFRGCVKKRRVRKKVLRDGKLADDNDVLEVVLRPGYMPGDKIRFGEAGDHGHGIVPADVVFVIAVQPHPHFTLLDNGDLRADTQVSLADALTGALVRLESLAGDTISVRIADVITPGQVRKVRGRGMPRPGNDGGKNGAADLQIHFHVDFPKTVAAEDKVKVRAALDAVAKTTAAAADVGDGPLEFRRASSLFTTSSGRSRNTVLANERPSEKKSSEKTTPEKRVSDLRASEKRASEKRASEKRASEKRASEKRASDNKALEEKSLAREKDFKTGSLNLKWPPSPKLRSRSKRTEKNNCQNTEPVLRPITMSSSPNLKLG